MLLNVRSASSAISFHCLCTSASRCVVMVGELDLREPWVCFIHESLVVCGWFHGVTVCSERGDTTSWYWYNFLVKSLRTMRFNCESI